MTSALASSSQLVEKGRGADEREGVCVCAGPLACLNVCRDFVISSATTHPLEPSVD